MKMFFTHWKVDNTMEIRPDNDREKINEITPRIALAYCLGSF